MPDDPTDFSSFETSALQYINRPKRNSVRFWHDQVVNPQKSAAAGYPVHDNVEKAMVRVPGSRDETPVKIDEKFLKEYGDLYERWKQTLEQPVDGLALELWPPIPKNLIEDWRYFGVRSVQQLAELNDTACQKMGMGMIEWRKKAQAWLAEAKDHAASQRLVSENEQLRREVDRLSKQVGDLARRWPTPGLRVIDMAAIKANDCRADQERSAATMTVTFPKTSRNTPPSTRPRKPRSKTPATSSGQRSCSRRAPGSSRTRRPARPCSGSDRRHMPTTLPRPPITTGTNSRRSGSPT